MKLSTVSILSAIAVFVATSPHAVAALVQKETSSLAQLGDCNHKEFAKTLAKEKLNKVFGKRAKREFASLSKLWGKESAWNWKANNPHSSAFGIAQVLGTPEDSTIKYQVNMGIKYIVHRYDTPSKAWSFWQRNGWY
jgi:hypothetical protein